MLSKIVLGMTLVMGSDLRTAEAPQAVSLSQLVESPKQFDGKRVSVNATYRVAFETAEIYCLSSLHAGHVWVTFEDSPGGNAAVSKLRRSLKNGEGSANAQFTGFFRGPGNYGHLGTYRFQFTVTSVTKVEQIDRSGNIPDALPPEVKQEVCK